MPPISALWSRSVFSLNFSCNWSQNIISRILLSLTYEPVPKRILISAKCTRGSWTFYWWRFKLLMHAFLRNSLMLWSTSMANEEDQAYCHLKYVYCIFWGQHKPSSVESVTSVTSWSFKVIRCGIGIFSVMKARICKLFLN